MLHYKLDNVHEFIEDPLIKEVRLEKERQVKKEEEEKVAKKILEKVIYNHSQFNNDFFIEFIK